LKRTWTFIPLFSIIVAFPAIFNFFTPGETVWGISFCGLKFDVTRQGLAGAALFIARVASSVSFAVLLALTTRHTELLKVLRAFNVPQLFVMTAGMCRRYIYVFTEIVINTHMAIKSRCGAAVRYREGQEIVTWSIANLWKRSYEMNREVYNAMLSRGYHGEVYVLDEFRADAKDWVFLGIAVVVALVVAFDVRF
ncbi:MAG: cobalt ECF transporter T component CbiQ, partial [Candidatus Omnitrophica bacterium]|nr:cobalt ECF transporter T component CbiQ [Candidatus Omnitrophota bacterium]